VSPQWARGSEIRRSWQQLVHLPLFAVKLMPPRLRTNLSLGISTTWPPAISGFSIDLYLLSWRGADGRALACLGGVSPGFMRLEIGRQSAKVIIVDDGAHTRQGAVQAVGSAPVQFP
jgi:hypothetical protein